MPTYQIQSLTKRFGTSSPVSALDNLSFTAHAGEFIVILGPTGAGKTTLLRTLCGLETPDTGTILCDQQDITVLSPPARDMAMVFQNFSLYPRLTVYQNLAFPLKPKWRKMAAAEIDRRVQWAADLLGLTPKLQQLPTQLSGGQQQRVAIGRAIVREPRPFLFDEPLASLDAKLREQMAVEIHRLQRKLQTTMLYVTHDQIEAMSLADRIIVMDLGRILQIGTPDEIYHHPATPRVAQMLGSPPVNLLTPVQLEILLPATQAATLNSQSCTFGLRPEHIKLAPSRTGPARAKLVEHLGPATVVLLEFPLHTLQLRALVPSDSPITAQDPLDISVQMNDLLRWPMADAAS